MHKPSGSSPAQRLQLERRLLPEHAQGLGEAERAEVEAQKQRYELHAQLTEGHRRCEDLQAQATRAERPHAPACYIRMAPDGSR